MIRGTKPWGPGLIRPALTTDGVECVEQYDGDVRAFLTPSQSGAVSYNQNFNAPVTGQVAQGQTIDQTQHQGIDPAALGEIFQKMRDALPDIDDPGDRDDAEHAIRELHDAVEEGNTPEVQKRAGRLQRLSARLGSTALTTAVAAATTELLQTLGLG